MHNSTLSSRSYIQSTRALAPPLPLPISSPFSDPVLLLVSLPTLLTMSSPVRRAPVPSTVAAPLEIAMYLFNIV
jgi:hypothetical protein